MTVLGEVPEHLHPVAGALGAIGDALDGVADVALWSLSDDAVAELVSEVHRCEGRLAELSARLVAEADRRELSKRAGGASTQAWLRRELKLAPGVAKQHMVLAAALAGPPELTREALAAGDISRAHAQVIVKAMDMLPSSLGVEALQRAERQLIEWCRDFDPAEVAGLGRRLFEVIDPDGADRREAKLLEKQEREAKRRRHLTFGANGFGLHHLRGQFDPESAAVIEAALDGLAQPLASTADGPDPRSPGQRYADALVEVCRRQLNSGDLPSRGGEKPHLVLTMRLDKLKGAVGSGLLDTGNVLSPQTARKLACDAQIIPALLGTDGQLLDLGRASRMFTAAQRRALALRDGHGCAFPGCDRPIAWCDAHHIHRWIDGGPTDLSNGVLLCTHHHTLIHHGDWAIRIAADRRPEFLPPPWIDPDRKPLRNHHQRE